MTKQTFFTDVLSQKFNVSMTGLNRIEFDTKFLFSPSLSNIYFCVYDNLEMGLVSTSLADSFDLAWNGSFLQRVNSINGSKFYLNIYVEQFIFEYTLTNLNNAIYYQSGKFNVSLTFWDNYNSSTQMINIFVWQGKINKHYN